MVRSVAPVLTAICPLFLPALHRPHTEFDGLAARPEACSRRHRLRYQFQYQSPVLGPVSDSSSSKR